MTVVSSLSNVVVVKAEERTDVGYVTIDFASYPDLTYGQVVQAPEIVVNGLDGASISVAHAFHYENGEFVPFQWLSHPFTKCF